MFSCYSLRNRVLICPVFLFKIKNMEQEKFAEFKLKVIKYVTDKWLEFDEEFPPHLFFINENGGRKMLPLPIEGFYCAESKEFLVEMIVHMLSSVKAEMSCITTEGWMVSSKEGEEDLKDENGNYVRPSQHPNKQEVLTFNFESIKDQEMITLLNENGKLSPYNPASNFGGDKDGIEKVQGIFQGLLKKSKEKW
jgi:hypothetical protein